MTMLDVEQMKALAAKCSGPMPTTLRELKEFRQNLNQFSETLKCATGTIDSLISAIDTHFAMASKANFNEKPFQDN